MRRRCSGTRCFGRGVVELWQREVGDLRPRSFANLVGASEDLILRLGIHKKLDKHNGCVNAVSFNGEGDILLSGSDDRMVIMWDWNDALVKLSFHSGHTNNVFQAKCMPFTDDRTIVTCAADGEVRHAELLEGGKVNTKMLARHAGRAHKIAIEPGSPYIFYSCGEDGFVRRFDLRSQSAAELLKCKSLESDYLVLHLNAIAIDPRNPNLLAVAGSEEYACLFDIRKFKVDGSNDFVRPVDCFCPPHLIGGMCNGITGLAYSCQGELLVSYSDDSIYLFNRGDGLGPNPSIESPKDGMCVDDQKVSCTETVNPHKTRPQVYEGHVNRDTVKSVSFFGPSCEYVTSGSDCGRIFIWRKKDGELLRVMEGDKLVVNCVEPHPHSPIFASCGLDNDVKIWVPTAIDPAPPVDMSTVPKLIGDRSFSTDQSDDDMIEDDSDDDVDDDDRFFSNDDSDDDCEEHSDGEDSDDDLDSFD